MSVWNTTSVHFHVRKSKFSWNVLANFVVQDICLNMCNGDIYIHTALNTVIGLMSRVLAHKDHTQEQLWKTLESHWDAFSLQCCNFFKYAQPNNCIKFQPTDMHHIFYCFTKTKSSNWAKQIRSIFSNWKRISNSKCSCMFFLSATRLFWLCYIGPSCSSALSVWVWFIVQELYFLPWTICVYLWSKRWPEIPCQWCRLQRACCSIETEQPTTSGFFWSSKWMSVQWCQHKNYQNFKYFMDNWKVDKYECLVTSKNYLKPDMDACRPVAEQRPKNSHRYVRNDCFSCCLSCVTELWLQDLTVLSPKLQNCLPLMLWWPPCLAVFSALAFGQKCL